MKVRKMEQKLFKSQCQKQPLAFDREQQQQLNFPHLPPTPSKTLGLLISSSG